MLRIALIPLLPDDFDQHPLPPPAVETHGPAVLPGLRRSAPRYQRCRRALGVRSVERLVEPSSRPTVTATTTSRPITRNTASSVPMQVSVGHPVTPFRTEACPWQARPVRLCNRPPGPASALINTLTVMYGCTMHCMAFTRVNAFLVVYYSHSPDGRGPTGHRPRPEQPQMNPTSGAENVSC
jgi:hypothetical protein